MTSITPTWLSGGDRTLTSADADVDLIAETLTRITMNTTRWEQNHWCRVDEDNGVDRLTPEHLEAGSYHDFTLPAVDLDVLRERYVDNYADHPLAPLPVADCGTSFCVAGDALVHHGWTFMGYAGEPTTAHVVPTTRVPDVMVGRASFHSTRLYAPNAAAALLRLHPRSAAFLFDGSNTLVRIWAMGYAVTGGRLTLPAALPGYDAAEDVYAAVMIEIAETAREFGDFAELVDLDALRALGPEARGTVTRWNFDRCVDETLPVTALIESVERQLADREAASTMQPIV